jgi:hypothetical protein
VGRGSSLLSCAVFLPLLLLQAFLLLITGRCCCSCQLPCLFTAHMEVGLPLSPVEFSSLHQSHKLSHSWLLGARPRSHWSLSSRQASLFTVPGRIPFPQYLVLSALHPLSHVSLLFLLLISQFLFFPRVRSVCPGGYAALAQGCLWEYCSTAKLTLSASSQAIWVRLT